MYPCTWKRILNTTWLRNFSVCVLGRNSSVWLFLLFRDILFLNTLWHTCAHTHSTDILYVCKCFFHSRQSFGDFWHSLSILLLLHVPKTQMEKWHIPLTWYFKECYRYEDRFTKFLTDVYFYCGFCFVWSIVFDSRKSVLTGVFVSCCSNLCRLGLFLH